jgi:hypothetical protein
MPDMQQVESPLFRRFSELKYAEAFVHGSIRLGSLRYYREIEDPLRRDELEGFGHFTSDGEEWHIDIDAPIYVLCMSRPNGNAPPGAGALGENVVIVHDPAALAADLERQMRVDGIQCFGPVHGRRVEYTGGEVVNVPDAPMARALYSVSQKPARFQAEREYRIFVYLNLGTALNPPKTIDVQLTQRPTYLEIYRRDA